MVAVLEHVFLVHGRVLLVGLYMVTVTRLVGCLVELVLVLDILESDNRGR